MDSSPLIHLRRTGENKQDALCHAIKSKTSQIDTGSVLLCQALKDTNNSLRLANLNRPTCL